MNKYIETFISYLATVLSWDMASTDNLDTVPPVPYNPASTPSPAAPLPSDESSALKVYTEAVANLGRHLTLNTAVNPETGCAEAVSTILLNVGYPVPSRGIPTVWGLIDWMIANGFKETQTPVPGAIITACRADRQPTEYAHVGVVMKHGIASNDSRAAYLGQFRENYSTIENWVNYFAIHNSVTRYFIPC